MKQPSQFQGTLRDLCFKDFKRHRSTQKVAVSFGPKKLRPHFRNRNKTRVVKVQPVKGCVPRHSILDDRLPCLHRWVQSELDNPALDFSRDLF